MFCPIENPSAMVALCYLNNNRFYDHFTIYRDIPGFDPLVYYPHVRGLRGGARNFKVVEDNLCKRGVRILYEAGELGGI